MSTITTLNDWISANSFRTQANTNFSNLNTDKVEWPWSSTDNAIARMDGTTWKIIQNSWASIDDSGNITATNLSWTNSWNETTTTVGSLINGATEKTTPVDNDMVWLMDSAASNILKKLSWANIKAWIKTYYDSVTATLTNKRITSRVKQDASHTTSVTMDSDSYDEYDITAQAWDLLFNNPSGTPTNCQKLLVRIKDNGTARALTYGAQFASGGWTLPTTTTISKKLWIWFEWDSSDSKWYCIATWLQP